jgi:mannose-6-phosphate isomerase-like protein (cupin superfamily)
MTDRLTPESALAKLAAAGGPEFVGLFRHGSLEVEVYRPVQVDRQRPHTRDEVYVVISGSGYFVSGESRRPFGPGEVLFVAAGVAHRFEEFTDDFATWVFFYGPEGGEAESRGRG